MLRLRKCNTHSLQLLAQFDQCQHEVAGIYTLDDSHVAVLVHESKLVVKVINVVTGALLVAVPTVSSLHLHYQLNDRTLIIAGWNYDLCVFRLSLSSGQNVYVDC